MIYIKSKKAAARAIYNASPEMKRAAYHASYRADTEEKGAASRVASRASYLPPRVPLFKAYFCSCCVLWSARISWFMTETDSTLFTTLPNKTTTAHTIIIKQQKITPQKMAETSHIKNISRNVHQCSMKNDPNKNGMTHPYIFLPLTTSRPHPIPTCRLLIHSSSSTQSTN